jgi:hypothetical protein
VVGAAAAALAGDALAPGAEVAVERPVNVTPPRAATAMVTSSGFAAATSTATH